MKKRVGTLVLILAAGFAVLQPAAAMAQDRSGYRYHDRDDRRRDWDRHEDRDRARRDYERRQWREHEWRERDRPVYRYSYTPGYYYNGYYNPCPR